MNKEPEFNGIFYPDDSSELKSLLDNLKQDLNNNYKSKLIIVPHAGYTYSGHAAMSAYQHLDICENVFIFAQAHKHNIDGIAAPKYTYFNTPLGHVEVNNRVIKELNKNYSIEINDEYFQNEHTIEVQLPFLQHLLMNTTQSAIDFVKNLKKIGKRLRIIPILVGNTDFQRITDIITDYWENSCFIITSDLSHYYNFDQCRQIDTYTAAIIEAKKYDLLENYQACGNIILKAAMKFAMNNNFDFIRIEMYNSGDICNEKTSVVGYGAWYLYNDTKNNFIKTYYSNYLLDVAKQCIINTINNNDYLPQTIPAVLTQYGAIFVTIKFNNELRGCIGSVYPTKPLILDLIDNTKRAAFADTRFKHIELNEVDKIEISISLLSSIERIYFKDEKDLLSKINLYGIIICDGKNRAVYLPEVWEQLPDKEVFLTSLKEKAGLPANYFSKSMEVYKFNTTVINNTLDEVL